MTLWSLLHPGDDRELTHIQDRLRAFLDALPLAEAERSLTHVAVLEAVVNAARHGRGTEEQAATLDVEVVDGQIVATVTDHGPGFDPASCPDPLDAARVDLPHGRGVFLMRALMDDVRFTFPPGGGTHVTLRRALPSSAPTGAARPAQGATAMSTTVNVEDSTGRIIINGSFDGNLSTQFEQESRKLLDNPEVKEIQIDFDQVDLIDSSGVAALVRFRARAKEPHRTIELHNCRDQVMQIFKLSGLDKKFTIR